MLLKKKLKPTFHLVFTCLSLLTINIIEVYTQKKTDQKLKVTGDLPTQNQLKTIPKKDDDGDGFVDASCGNW